MPHKATLQDVALAAGVHRTTVSLALRQHPRIPQETRVRIQQIAERLHYRINPLVSALMQSRRTGKGVRHATLAFVTAYPTRYGWRPDQHDRPDFFPGALARARDLGYKLEDFWLAEPGMTPSRFCDILSNRGIHGLLIARLPPGLHSLDLQWERFASVALGLTLRTPSLHHVTENHFDTVWQDMQQCHDHGYRRVGLVYSEANDSPRVGERWLGAFLGQQHLLFPARDHVPPCPQIPADEESFVAWFRRHRPDALICTHARPVQRWLARLGLSCPHDLGLIDLDSHPAPGCAGLRYDFTDIGALGVETLVGLLHRNESGLPSSQHEILLKGTWHEGRSLRPFA
jgi:LacI family transcriptional regulator